MIYQEINLPVWGQLVLMAFWLSALVLLLYIKPREDVKQENTEKYTQTTLKSDTELIFNCMASVTTKEV
ncbi:hypothetical protein [Streptococcus infantarius]|uniref:hypothetical protein n=1 Tax=Streptococcus infantarius TaxID=102684 RepID=UPI0022E650EC|nr:hypothetical protein [Streptococcus infantarius]